MDVKSKLRNLLESVSDSYPMFVISGMSMADKRPDYAEKVIDFIEKNPDATSSDVVLFETEEILGIKPVYEE